MCGGGVSGQRGSAEGLEVWKQHAVSIAQNCDLMQGREEGGGAKDGQTSLFVDFRHGLCNVSHLFLLHGRLVSYRL